MGRWRISNFRYLNFHFIRYHIFVNNRIFLITTRLIWFHCFQTVNETEYDEAMELLQSEAEAKRRKEFEAVLRVQEENKGLIEAGKNKVLFQRMFISEPASLSTTATDAVNEQEDMGTTTNHFIGETGHVYPENEAGSSNYEKSNMKNMPRGYPRKKRSTQRSIKQRWIKKEYGPH